MSISIVLDNQPEFYTNLDSVQGRILLSLTRAEHVGGIIVKLEGESKTALALPSGFDDYHSNITQQPRLPGTVPPGHIISESHKTLYKVQQVFPTYDDDVANATTGGSHVLQADNHEFPFNFRIPLNNACSDPVAMAKMGGLGGVGGFGAGGGMFGLGGMRVMDGSKQLFLPHVTKTLPPSFTGLPRAADIRYYVKVTIQRPGLLRENWRYQVGFKFMPIEPPRPPKSSQEAFARRPFKFRLRPTPATTAPPLMEKKRSSIFGVGSKDKEKEKEKNGKEATATAAATMGSPNGGIPGPDGISGAGGPPPPPCIEISARLPHPSILTCNEPVPLRLMAKKLAPSRDQVYLTHLQIELIGALHLRAHQLHYNHPNRWTVVHKTDIEVPVLTDPSSDGDEGATGRESIIPDDLWRTATLPNTVAPSFSTCNLERSYQLEIKLGLSWGRRRDGGGSGGGGGKVGRKMSGLMSGSSGSGSGSSSGGRGAKDLPPQTIYLPLSFSKIQVYSSIPPPPELVNAIHGQQHRPAAATVSARPPLPPRTNTAAAQGVGPATGAGAGASGTGSGSGSGGAGSGQGGQGHDQLYPPQLGAPGAGAGAPPYEEAPPSYDEAMAAQATGPFDGLRPRPAFSGVTNENAPSEIPEKN